MRGNLVWTIKKKNLPNMWKYSISEHDHYSSSLIWQYISFKAAQQIMQVPLLKLQSFVIVTPLIETRVVKLNLHCKSGVCF